MYITNTLLEDEQENRVNDTFRKVIIFAHMNKYKVDHATENTQQRLETRYPPASATNAQ